MITYSIIASSVRADDDVGAFAHHEIFEHDFHGALRKVGNYLEGIRIPRRDINAFLYQNKDITGLRKQITRDEISFVGERFGHAVFVDINKLHYFQYDEELLNEITFSDAWLSHLMEERYSEEDINVLYEYKHYLTQYPSDLLIRVVNEKLSKTRSLAGGSLTPELEVVEGMLTEELIMNNINGSTPMDGRKKSLITEPLAIHCLNEKLDKYDIQRVPIRDAFRTWEDFNSLDRREALEHFFKNLTMKELLYLLRQFEEELVHVAPLDLGMVTYDYLIEGWGEELSDEELTDIPYEAHDDIAKRLTKYFEENYLKVPSLLDTGFSLH